MKNNIVKNILKTTAATAIAATIFIGTGKDAKACGYCGDERLDAYAAAKGITCKDILENPVLFDEYASAVLEADGGLDAFLGSLNVAEESYTQKDMLALVNADRAANGRSALVWDDELAEYANRRILEVFDNYHSEDYMNAYKTGGNRAAIAHRGLNKGLGENALVVFSGSYSMEIANKAWINSASHHATRNSKNVIKYAAACIIDEVTGDNVWIELFADNSFKGASSFDYIRYAKDYPDLAAAFGQDKNALYKHYRTYGRNEGRKAYYTDGTLIKM